MRRTTDNEQKLTGLKGLLQERGLKAVWVARNMGVSKSTLTYWFKAGVPDEHVKPLAKLLKVRQKDIRR